MAVVDHALIGFASNNAAPEAMCCAGEHRREFLGGVAEKAHVQKSPQTELGSPEPANDRPTGARKRLGRLAAPHLQYGHTILFFYQAKYGNTATESGCSGDEVEIEWLIARRHKASAIAQSPLKSSPSMS
jgi:hypothetical protein